MSVIPSIILSAALSCGAVPADVQGILNTIENSAGNCANIQCSDAESILDMLENLGVNTDGCGIKDFINRYLNGGGQASPELPDPTASPTVTQAPTPTKPPVITQAPMPTKAPVVTQAPMPTKAPVVTPTPSIDSSTSSYARQVVDLVNRERTNRGLSPLTIDNTLMNAAQTRAVETVRSFSHTRPNGSSFSSVLSEYNYSYRTAGENIAYGQRTPQEVVTAWMNSSGHRANILNANYTKIGVGCYKSGSTYYWSQLFAG